MIRSVYKPRFLKNEQISTEKEIQMALKTYEKLFNFNHSKKPTIFSCTGWVKVQAYLSIRWAKIQKCVNSVGRTVGNSYIAGGNAN